MYVICFPKEQNSVTELNIEEFEYIGEPITVACVSSEE